MPTLPDSLRAWQTNSFNQTLKRELRALPGGTLPLHKGTTQGGLVDDSDIAVTILRSSEDGSSIQAEIGVFFHEIVGGCSCGDDPVADNSYCELRITIDKISAEAHFSLI
jgi:hypothetical protein